MNMTSLEMTDLSREGVGFFSVLKKVYNSTFICNGQNSETVFAKLNIPGKAPVILCCAYRAPNLSSVDCKKLCDEIREIKSKFKNSIFWLSGDFNLPDIDWKTEKIIGKQYSSSINQLFLDLAHDLGLTQTVNDPTRGSNILDLFFTNNINFINKTTVISGVSDHEAVTIESKLSLQPKKSPTRIIQLWNKANIDKIKEETKKFCNLFKYTCVKQNVNAMWLFIKQNILKIINDNVPTKKSSAKFHQPWITTHTKRLIRNKNLWFQKAKQRNDIESWKKYKNYKKLAQKSCRKSHDDYVQDLITTDNSNKKFWSYVKSQRKENTGISDLNVNNKLIQNPKEKADLFNNQFSKVFSDPNEPSPPFTTTKVNPNTIHNIKVSEKGVLKLLQGVNENKATGPDDIPGKFYKICSNELCEAFTLLYQTSLNSGVVPDDWKTANIFPLFKKGDKNNVENYRPISLTSIACKLLEHIVHSTTMDFLDSNNILTPYQHGFRQGRSCESQLLTTLNDFTKTFNSSGQTDAILLDFSKAFDKVDHKILLSKIDAMGIQGPLHDWMSSFLKDRLQYVIVDGSSSEPCKVLSGVPQGTVLGPLFFLIYINDIQDNLSPGTSIRLFADESPLQSYQ